MIGVFDDLDHFRNHVAAALDADPVADQQAEALDEVGIVQGGAADGGAADEDGRQLGDGRELAGAAHLHGDGVDLSDARFGCELVCNGPAGGAAGVAEAKLRGVGVDLEDHSVDLVAERGALRFGLIDEAGHLFDGRNEFAMGIDAEAKGGKRIESGALTLRPVLALDQQEVCKEDEPAIGNDTRFKCAQGSGRCVAGVDGEGQSLLLALLIQALERSFGHDYLATDFESLRESDLVERLGRNGERDAADGADVGGDVLAGLAVAAGDATDEACAAGFGCLIVQGHAQTVELEFGHVLDREQPCEFAHTTVPVGQFFAGIGVVQAEHGAGVAHLLEALGRLAADTLRGRVGRE